jgi:hypothetical protein
MRYDFAHQRFKEVLAAKYVATHLAAEDIYALIEREDLAEFVYVLAKQASIGQVVLKRILQRAADPARNAYFGRMASDLLRTVSDTSAREDAAQFLVRAIIERQDIQVTRQFISEVAFTGELLAVAERAFQEGLRERIRGVFTLGSTVLQEHVPARLWSLLDEHLEEAWNAPEISMDALALAYDGNPALLFKRLDRIRQSPRAFSEVAYVIATATSAVDDLPASFMTALVALPMRDLALLLATIEAVNPALFGSLARTTQTPERIEAVMHIVRFAHLNSGVWSLMSGLSRPVFVVTRRPLAAAEFKPDEKRPTLGDVFVERFLGDSAKLPAASKRTDAATTLTSAEVVEISRAITHESDARREGRTPRRRELPFLLK